METLDERRAAANGAANRGGQIPGRVGRQPRRRRTTYTLYLVPGNLYVVHVDKGEESWLESMGGKGFTDAQVKMFFSKPAAAAGLD